MPGSPVPAFIDSLPRMPSLRISTGTGLALLAGAITLHAVLPHVAARVEPSADAAWTPIFVPGATEPQKAPRAEAGAPAVAPTIPSAVGLAAMPGSSGTTTVLFRLWSNGHVDRRLTSSTNGLTWQGGWQSIWVQPGNVP